MSRLLYADDVVAQKSDPSLVAVVERTHGDVDTHAPYPGRSEEETINCDRDIPQPAFRQFLRDGIPPPGTTLVRWQHSVHPQLTLESKLEVLDRALLIGDVVKKNASDTMSGIVLNTYTTCTLQPMCKISLHDNSNSGGIVHLQGLPTPTGTGSRAFQASVQRSDSIREVPASELIYADSPTVEDLVLYKGWVGRVGDVVTMITLRLSDNGVVEIGDEDADHLDGSYASFSIGDVVVTKKGILRTGRWIYGKYNPNTIPAGTVVQMRVTTAGVQWLERRIGISADAHEPPVELEREQLESQDFYVYDRTKRPAMRQGVAGPPENISNSGIDVRLNLRVRFRDLAGACVKYNGTDGNGNIDRIDRRDSLGYDLNVFDVLRFRTDAVVQWQDLTVTRENSIDLIPEIVIDDEHDAWPGELVHPLALEVDPSTPDIQQAKKVGIVQTVDAKERMARVRWCPNSCVQYSSDPTDPAAPSGAVVTSVGLAAGEPEEVSLYDIEAPGELNFRRGDLVLIAKPRSSQLDHSNAMRTRDWIGEIVDTPLNGSLIVRLGAVDPVRDVVLRREDVVVAIRSDGTDAIAAWDETAVPPGIHINEDGDLELHDPDDLDPEADWFDEEDHYLDLEEEASRREEATYMDEHGRPMDEDEVDDEEWESESDDVDGNENGDVPMPDWEDGTPSETQFGTPQEFPNGSQDDQSAPLKGGPPAYAVLSDAVPPNHAFGAQTSGANATHIKRTAKEHRILSDPSNLPSGVYVRTWESRLDLLRVLFIGPADTPYADAPFVIDFHLPANFPAEPPHAFFHSWRIEHGLDSIGKINPNMYEDGTVCLSLLGTWETSGKGSSEGWNAARSTLLQVIVSLLGLVLVREPYFNEAGYETLAGLESSKRPSELYSERVYLKSRTFVITAVTSVLGDSHGKVAGVHGLEDVLKWLYWEPAGPKLLQKNVADVEAILARSSGRGEVEQRDQSTGMRISKGACILLRKILVPLNDLAKGLGEVAE